MNRLLVSLTALKGLRAVTGASLLAAAVTLTAVACSSDRAPERSAPVSQRTFASPEQAVEALREATAARDRDELRRIFGPEVRRILSDNPRQDERDFQRFAAALERRRTLLQRDDGSIVLRLGLEGWDFPAPLVERGGRWRFDTEAGADEVLTRRIGENELHAIATSRYYVRAQNEYAAMDPEGRGSGEFAARLRSTPGKRDGLYWPDAEGQPASPLGPAVARAVAAGELDEARKGPQPYRGYFYKILTRQGPAAPGGARSYLDGSGRMTGGFALLAWPAEYGRTGVMSFTVAADGVVYQRDLGDRTGSAAAAIDSFDPHAGWVHVDSPSHRQNR